MHKKHFEERNNELFGTRWDFYYFFLKAISRKQVFLHWDVVKARVIYILKIIFKLICRSEKSSGVEGKEVGWLEVAK